MNNDKLLFGKSDIRRIVGLEVIEDQVELFIQDESGIVTSEFRPHQYWVLSDTPVSRECKRLEGDLHFKFAKRFKYRKEFEKSRIMYKNSGYDVYSIYNAEQACMVKDGYTFYRDMQPKELSLLSFDLETTGLDGNAPDAKILLISATCRKSNGYQYNELFRYDEYADEKAMIEDFCEFVTDENPSLIIGHNIISYDFPYLAARCNTLGATLNLGRNGSQVEFNTYKSKFRLDGTRSLEYENVKIYGREIVDTYFLAVSFDVSKSMESYGLKPLIKQLGFEKPGRQYYDAGSIRDHYTNPVEWAKICQYAIEDAEDAIKLWDYMGPAKFYWVQKVPMPFSELLLGATGSQINSLMLRAYLQDAHSIPKADTVVKFQGAISLGIPGIFTNCIRWDVASLYPSIILEYRVYDEDKDPEAYFLKLVSILTKTRLEHKKLAKETGSKYYSDLEQSEKIGINSAYGFMGASGLNFNCPQAADFITEKGREILLKAINWSTGLKNEEIIHLCANKFEDE